MGYVGRPKAPSEDFNEAFSSYLTEEITRHLSDVGDTDCADPEGQEEEGRQVEGMAAAELPSSAADLQPPKMNIAVLVVGTRGDVQPFIQLGRRLAQDGHRVPLASHDVFEGIVLEAGLEFFPLGGDPKKLSQFMCETGGRLMPNVLDKTEVKGAEEKMAMLKEMMFATYRACTESQRGHPPFVADAIIANPVAYGHVHVAEKLGVPVHLMFPQPWTATGDFPHPLSIFGSGCSDRDFMPSKRVRRASNYASYLGVEKFLWTGFRFMTNEFRRHLGLEPIRAGEDGAHILHRHNVPFAYQWSPHVLHRPMDYGPKCEVTGNIFNNDAATYRPPAELEEWLQEGDKPIFVGFGSMVIRDGAELSRAIVRAAREAGARVILQSSWSSLAGTPEHDAPDKSSDKGRLVYHLENCPHDWLFSRVAAVVHHGGAGTIHAGLRAGVPTLVCPFFGDQHLWAQALHRVGAAMEPYPIQEVTKDGLAQAFRTLRGQNAEGKAMIDKALQLGSLLAQEDGVEQALRSFYRHLPLEGLVCDVSLMLGPSRDVRMARWYSQRLGLKVCSEVYRALESTVPPAEFEEYGFVQYKYRMGWAFTEPQTFTEGITQSIKNLGSRFVLGGAGLVWQPVQCSIAGARENGFGGAVGGALHGVLEGAREGTGMILRSSCRLYEKPLHGWKVASHMDALQENAVAHRPSTNGKTDLHSLRRSITETDSLATARMLDAYEVVLCLKKAWRNPTAEKDNVASVHGLSNIRMVSRLLHELLYPRRVQEKVLSLLRSRGANLDSSLAGGVAESSSPSVGNECNDGGAVMKAASDASVCRTDSRRERLKAKVAQVGSALSSMSMRCSPPASPIDPDEAKVSFEEFVSLLQPHGIPIKIEFHRLACQMTPTAEYHVPVVDGAGVEPRPPPI